LKIKGFPVGPVGTTIAFKFSEGITCPHEKTDTLSSGRYGTSWDRKSDIFWTMVSAGVLVKLVTNYILVPWFLQPGFDFEYVNNQSILDEDEAVFRMEVDINRLTRMTLLAFSTTSWNTRAGFSS
jgi:hypothetical protein